MKWMDFRLNYSTPINETQALQLDGNSLEEIWIPNMYFPNGKKGLMHDIVRENIQIQIFENGTVMYSQR